MFLRAFSFHHHHRFVIINMKCIMWLDPVQLKERIVSMLRRHEEAFFFSSCLLLRQPIWIFLFFLTPREL